MKTFISCLLLLLVIVSACSLTELGNSQQFSAENESTNTAIVSWFDALDVMAGVCFESAFDAINQTFIIRNQEELFTFFDLVDNSRLCRFPIDRYPFDFSQGSILAGIWTYGTGCTAGHDVLEINRDDEAKIIRFTLEFYTEGDCPYELIRPFWIGIRDASDYDIILDVRPQAEGSTPD